MSEKQKAMQEKLRGAFYRIGDRGMPQRLERMNQWICRADYRQTLTFSFPIYWAIIDCFLIMLVKSRNFAYNVKLT